MILILGEQDINVLFQLLIIGPQLVFVMLVIRVVNMAARNQIHVFKLLVPFCLLVNQEQYWDGLLPEKVPAELWAGLAVKATGAFIFIFCIPSIDGKNSTTGHQTSG
jgi:hypothetical protein